MTGGDVSLDVEDGRGSRGWPGVEDVADTMMCCSVHLPLEPRVRLFLLKYYRTFCMCFGWAAVLIGVCCCCH